MTERQSLIDDIKRLRQPEPVKDQERPITFGQRLAEGLAARIGSWPFLIVQTAFLAGWIVANSIPFFPGHRFDVYPYILLNLCLSFQAAYSGPVILMSQNRQSAKDRELAQNTFRLNQQIDRVLQFMMSHLELQHRVMLDQLHEIADQERAELNELAHVHEMLENESER